ncbi:hypothetical protein GCM10027294_23710 [Marinactinospora endophytica]
MVNLPVTFVSRTGVSRDGGPWTAAKLGISREDAELPLGWAQDPGGRQAMCASGEDRGSASGAQ